uniref:N-terminal Ras-GEF domain-containing protein n=1 Tax=Oryzias sinensis TaxID=183150 RepID=A0A8C7ZYC4_9TELE
MFSRVSHGGCSILAPQDPVQEWVDTEEGDAVFGVTLRREPVPPGADPAEPSSSPFSCVQYHAVKVRRLKAGTLGRLVAHLLDPESREADFIHVFLSTYRAFTSPRTLRMFERFPLLPVVRLWLDEYSKDFQEPPDFPALRLLCAHLQGRLCFRRLAQKADVLLKRLQQQGSLRSDLRIHV